MKILALANQKGGVGKTTSAIGIGCCLANMGHKTLLIDLDHQGNLSDDMGRGDEDYTITDLFENPKKFDLNTVVYSAKDQDREIDNLWIIPSDITLAVEARSAERYRHRLHILEDGLKSLKQDFDFIVIDLRPAIDLSIENALLVTDLVVIPVDMDRRAVKGIDDLLEVIQEVKRTDQFAYTLVATKINRSHRKMLDSTMEVIENKGYPIAQTQVRVSELYKQASQKHRPSVLFAPNEKPHEDYMALAKELMKKLGEGDS